MLRHFINPLIIYLFSASQHNYGREMLFYWWNLSLVNIPELQYAILSSRLINWLSRATIYKAINLGLKYLNSSCKIKIKYYKNLTHNADIIFNRVCLLNTWVRALRKRLEAIFSEYMPRSYTTTIVLPDMFLLTYTLFTLDLAKPRSTKQLASIKFFNSSNIL